MMRQFAFTFLVLVLLVGFVSADLDRYEKYFKDRHDPEYGGVGVTREEIIENMERRKEQLQRMLEESKDKLTRHLAGENVFEDDETHETVKRRMEIIEKKLERMDVLDEHELERMQRREARRWERRRSRSREL